MENLLNPYKSSGIKPAAGKLLIAAPYLIDPNFARTVILLCEHNYSGSVGFVLNRPTDMLLNQALPDVDNDQFELYEGGPVGTDTLHVVHRLQQTLTGKKVAEEIFWGADFEKMKEDMDNRSVTTQDIKLFGGYSGWEKGQLQDEIKQNSWLVADALPELVFNTRSRDLWRKSLASLGNEYAYLANIPLHPQMN